MTCEPGHPQQSDYAVLHPHTFSSASLARERFALDVLLGLSSERKFIPSKYFYDDEGSRIFCEIMDLAEYYPTRCEAEILRRHGPEIAELIGEEPFSLIELGAGDGRKTKLVLEACLSRQHSFHYVPIDISEASVATLTGALRQDLPELQVRGLVADYYDGLRWLGREAERRSVVLFLGSNIGNFDGPASRVFLRTLWNVLRPGDLLLIGLDLKKDISLMHAAYNDRKGVTRRFNLNVLDRINRELDADFELQKFQHFAPYNVFTGAMESYLVSTQAQLINVRALNRTFRFAPFEPILLEQSYKYLREDVPPLADAAGYRVVATFSDERNYFVDSLWQVVKDSPPG
jgi:L-histidine N-alpha-methyltransferase